MNSAPAPSRPSSRPVIVLVIVHGLAWVPFFLFMFLIAPRYQNLFIGMELPALTEQVLACSEFVVGSSYLVFAGLAAFLTLDGAVLVFLRRHSSTPLLSWLWVILVALVPLSAWACSWLSVWQQEM